MCERIYRKAQENNFDLMLFGYKTALENKEILPIFKEGIMLNPVAEIKTYNEINSGNALGLSWRYTFKRAFIKAHHIEFNGNIKIGEDTLFNMESVFQAQSIYILHEALYNYNDCNVESVMRQTYKKNFLEQLEMQYIRRVELAKQYGLMESTAFREDLRKYYVRTILINLIRNAMQNPSKFTRKEMKEILNTHMIQDNLRKQPLEQIYSLSDSLIHFIFLLMCKIGMSRCIYRYSMYFYKN